MPPPPAEQRDHRVARRNIGPGRQFSEMLAESVLRHRNRMLAFHDAIRTNDNAELELGDMKGLD